MTVALPISIGDRPSPFTGADVCGEASLHLPEGAPRPIFEDDMWDFGEVIGLPADMRPHLRRLDFTTIDNPSWRLVAKELILALLAPRHPAVVILARANRTPLHLRTCWGRLFELTSWLNWLSTQGVRSLSEVNDRHCETYLAHRRYVRDEKGQVIGELGPAVRRMVVQAVADLVSYRELFSADRVDVTLRPWAGTSPSAVAEMPSGRDQNKTVPLDDTVFRPMLCAALYLTGTLGPHVSDLALRAARRPGPIARCQRQRRFPPSSSPPSWTAMSKQVSPSRCCPTMTCGPGSPRAGPQRTPCLRSACTPWPTRLASGSSTADGWCLSERTSKMP